MGLHGSGFVTSRTVRPKGQFANLYRVAIGDVVVTAILDTYAALTIDPLVGLGRAELERLHAASFRPIPAPVLVSAFLIEHQGRYSLVDAGCGPAIGPEGGGLLAGLTALGLQPADIDTILLTHLHTDHIAGLFDADGKLAFPQARLVMHEIERDFWFGHTFSAPPPGISDQLPAIDRLKHAQATILTAREGEIAPGVEMVHLPGHTPGHCGYRIASGRDELFLWGDIVHQPHIQFAHPQVGTIWDVDYDQACRTRRKVMDSVVAGKTLIGSAHLDFPPFGRVAREGDAYRFLPSLWSVLV